MLSKIFIINSKIHDTPINFFELSQKNNSLNNKEISLKSQKNNHEKNFEKSENLEDIQSVEEKVENNELEKKKLITVQKIESNISNLNDINSLFQYIKSLSGSIIQDGSLRTVLYDGPTTSPLMIIGEAPGEEEDKLEKPFVGRSGQLLNKMLEYIELKREKIYITNVVYWRPSGNRTPTLQEIKLMSPIMNKQINLLKPKVILLLGSVAMKTVLPNCSGIKEARGKVYEFITDNKISIPVILSFHPSFLLRFPPMKAEAKNDMKLLLGTIEKNDILDNF